MSELLDKIPGVQVIDGQANIRGGSGYSFGAGSRALLLIDDVPALQADAGRPLWDDIPVENISQIEVLKGASSALYGSASLNGVINIRTGYATSEPVTKAFVAYGLTGAPSDERKHWWAEEDYQPRTITAGISHKQKFGKLDVVGAGFVELDDQVTREAYKDRYRLSANLKYRLTDRVTLGLNTMYNYKDSGSFLLWDNARAGAFQGFDGTWTAGVTQRFYVDPQLTYYDQNNNRHKVLGRYYWINNGSTTDQATNSTNTYLEYQYTSKKEAWGLDYTAGTSAYLVETNSELYGNVDLGNDNFAAFGQLDKKWGALTVTAGLRYENNRQDNVPDPMGNLTVESEGRVVSRFGLNFKASEGTYLRGSWGQGYRFPTIAERFIFTDLGGFFILPNPTLESEQGWTSELGFKQSLDIGSGSAYVDVAIFRSEYENMMEFAFTLQDDQFGFQSQNVGNTVINGFEIDLEGTFPLSANSGFKILSGYTYIDPSYSDFESNDALRATISSPVNNNEDPNFLKYRSRHNFKVDLEVKISNLSFGSAFNYTSQMVTIDQFLSDLNEIGQFRSLNDNGFFRWDGRVAYQLSQVKISLQGKNLNNNEFSIRPGILEPPRSVALRLDVSL